MEGQRILDKLKLQGYNFTLIAKVVGVSTNLVSQVAHRKRHNYQVAVAIATALGKPASSVFPDIPMYHGPYMTERDREIALARKLDNIGAIRRSA